MTGIERPWWGLGDINLKLGNIAATLQVLAERLDKGDGSPEGPCLWFALQGLQDQQKELEEIINSIHEAEKAEKPKSGPTLVR